MEHWPDGAAVDFPRCPQRQRVRGFRRPAPDYAGSA
jgi:hypothetical protein